MKRVWTSSRASRYAWFVDVMVWLVVVGLSREKGKEGNHLNLCCYDYLPTFIFFLQKDLSTLSYSERAEEPIQDMVLVGTSGWLQYIIRTLLKIRNSLRKPSKQIFSKLTMAEGRTTLGMLCRFVHKTVCYLA
jgi:hypothetical protein